MTVTKRKMKRVNNTRVLKTYEVVQSSLPNSQVEFWDQKFVMLSLVSFSPDAYLLIEWAPVSVGTREPTHTSYYSKTTLSFVSGTGALAPLQYIEVGKKRRL